MLDVFIIQSVFIIVFRWVFGVDVPIYAVWACIFGTGAVQRLTDNWKIITEISGAGEDVEPSVWHCPVFLVMMWWFFWLAYIFVRLIWTSPVDYASPGTFMTGSVGAGSSFVSILESVPIISWLGFYCWGLMTSIMFDVVAFRSKLLYPISDGEWGLDLVNRFNGKGGGWMVSIAITIVWGLFLSIILLDIFWSNLFF